MRKIFKGVLVLGCFIMILALMPVPQATAASTETFVNQSPHFTLTVPKWMDSSKSRNPNMVLRRALDPDEITTFEAAVADLPEGVSYKDLAKGLIDFFKEKYNASACKTLYEREIKLQDGTPAYELEVRWAHPAILLFTYEVVVFKDKKMVTVSVTDANRISDKLKQIPMSLTFK